MNVRNVLIITLILLTMIIVPVSADSHGSTLINEIDADYDFVIPSEIYFDQGCSIQVSNVVLETGKSLTITVESDDWKLSIPDSQTDTISYEMLADGVKYTPNTPLLSIAFPADSGSKELTFNLLEDVKKAGRYTDSLTFVFDSEGSSTAVNEYEFTITDKDDMVAFSQVSGSIGTGKTIKLILENNIDMSGVDWHSGVGQTTHFKLYGNGYTISNLKTDDGALFVPKSNYKITITKLNLESCEVSTSSDYAGLLIGYADANQEVIITDCKVENCKVSGNDYVGAFVGWSTRMLDISGCSVSGSELTGGGSTGGIAGHVAGDSSGVVNILDVSVTGNTITGEKIEKSGIVVGTANIGTTTITTTDISGNTVFGVSDSDAIYGRFVPASTGKLTVNGVEIINS